MAIRLINYVNNQKTSPALYTGSFSERPAAGIFGRLFMSIDTKEIFQDLSTSWQLLADAGAGAGTLESVTANGNSTTYGITILAGNLSLTNAVSTFSVKGLAIGGVLFPDDSSGLISQDTTNFFWDNTNNRLGIGTNTPSGKLDIHGTGINAILNGTGTNNSFLVFQNAGTSKWYAGNLFSGAVANDFVIYDAVNAAYRLYVHNTGVINIPTSLIIGSATPTSIYTLDVTGSGNFSAGLNAGFFNATTATIPANGMYLSGANTLNFATNTTNRFSISSTGAATFSSGLEINSSVANIVALTMSANSSGGVRQRFLNQAASGVYNFQIGSNITTNNAFEIIPSTAADGTTFSTAVFKILNTGAATFAGSVGIGAAPNANYRTFIQASTTVSSSFGLYIEAGTNSSDTALAVNSSGGTSPLFSVKGDGTVLLNTTTNPYAHRLVVQGSSLQAISAKTDIVSNEVITVWNAANAGDNVFQAFYTNTSITSRGSIDFNRTATLTRYNTISDANLKNIIGDSDKKISIEILNSTRIREYSWKEDETNKPQIGVIAQELYETFKGAVVKGSDFELFNTEVYKNWQVDKTAFTFHLIAGWQKHEQIIQELNEKLIRNNIN